MDSVQTGGNSSKRDVNDRSTGRCSKLLGTRDYSGHPTYDFPFDVVSLVFDMSLVTIHNPALDGYKKIRFKFMYYDGNDEGYAHKDIYAENFIPNPLSPKMLKFDEVADQMPEYVQPCL